MSILDKILGSSYQRVLKTLQSKVDQINKLEDDIKKYKPQDFKKRTADFREQLKGADGNRDREREILDQLLPECFALVREATRRIWSERHFDVQLIGGIVLHQGKISEMKTGEGKTIVATLPLYLNALCGRGAHLVTVNDYLSKHQGEGMGEIYNYLGLSTGVIQSNQISYKFEKTKDYKHYSECDGSNLLQCSRKEAYGCDITYGTNNEFGFDYLRDNMAPALEYCVQRQLFYAIVDEVDSILIDEARTPLIISSPAEESASLYQRFASLVPNLKADQDYALDEKDRAVSLTDNGIKKMEELLGVKNIYETNGVALVHHLEQALKAQTLFKKDRDYVVKDGEIIIVDEFTGRLMIGRRYSEGLHQAIEAKEGVEVQRESQTLATITFQNLFRIYTKLAGMTGTAATEAEEFFKIYKLDVVEIPTNEPMVRQDLADRIYKTELGKYNAITGDVKERNQKGQPVLIGTVSVEKNELLSKMLKRAGVKHEVLNAKHHEREAKIIAKAGLKGGVTVATNMAGRGTDIKLEKGVTDLGGLHVLGSERHEARRIDNQLRGRSGRQGDPGSSQFYVSLEDDLMRIFGGDRIKVLMDRLGLPEDQPIENSMISRSIESSQKKVEGHNFDIRKHLVEYDDVMNRQREVIYKKRRRILESQTASSAVAGEATSNLPASPAGGKPQTYNSKSEKIEENINDQKRETLKEEILGIVEDQIDRIFGAYPDDTEKIKIELKTILGENDFGQLEADKIKKICHALYQEREKRFTPEVMRNVEKTIYLRTIDMLWVEHLTTMEELREGIGLQSYGQKDPLVEYKREAFEMFQRLLATIEANVARTIFKVEVQAAPAPQPVERRPLEYKAPDPDNVGNLDDEVKELEKEATKLPQNFSTEGTRHKEQSSDGTVKQPASLAGGSSSGVTTTIREPGGKTIHDRMMASSGDQGTIKSGKKVGRNEPCPCGATKPDGRPVKYKHCCGR